MTYASLKKPVGFSSKTAHYGTPHQTGVQYNVKKVNVCCYIPARHYNESWAGRCLPCTERNHNSSSEWLHRAPPPGHTMSLTARRAANSPDTTDAFNTKLNQSLKPNIKGPNFSHLAGTSRGEGALVNVTAYKVVPG